MHIVVLLKAVPVVGNERLDASHRTQRSSGLESNGNDEYMLEAALKLAEQHGGEVTLLSVGPAGASEALRKALAMGATRAVHVTDDAIAGSCALATVRVLAAALAKLEFDFVFAGADTSDGQGGVVAAAVAAKLGLPYLSYASRDRACARRLIGHGASLEPEWLRRARVTDACARDGHATPRRAALSIAARDHAGAFQGDVLAEPSRPRHRPRDGRGGGAPRPRCSAPSQPPARGGATVVKEAPETAVAQIVDFLASRRLI